MPEVTENLHSGPHGQSLRAYSLHPLGSPSQPSSGVKKGKREQDFSSVQEQPSRSLELSNNMVSHLNRMNTLPQKIWSRLGFHALGCWAENPCVCQRLEHSLQRELSEMGSFPILCCLTPGPSLHPHITSVRPVGTQMNQHLL